MNYIWNHVKSHEKVMKTNKSAWPWHWNGIGISGLLLAFNFACPVGDYCTSTQIDYQFQGLEWL